MKGHDQGSVAALAESPVQAGAGTQGLLLSCSITFGKVVTWVLSFLHLQTVNGDNSLTPLGWL